MTGKEIGEIAWKAGQILLFGLASIAFLPLVGLVAFLSPKYDEWWDTIKSF